MAELRLLERLKKTADAPHVRGRRNAEEVVNSVVQHLVRVLNTRKGTVLLDPEFGLPDYTNFGSSFSEDTVQELRKCMEDLINKYEPRVNNLRITPHPPDPVSLQLIFDFEASITLDGTDIPVKMQTSVGHNGKVYIKPRGA